MKLLAFICLLSWVWVFLHIAANPRRDAPSLPSFAAFFSTIALCIWVLLG